MAAVPRGIGGVWGAGAVAGLVPSRLQGLGRSSLRRASSGTARSRAIPLPKPGTELPRGAGLTHTDLQAQ